MKQAILVVICALVMASCKTREVFVGKTDTVFQIREVHDTLRVQSVKTDTLRQMDSVVVWLTAEGEVKEKLVYRDRWRVRELHDTVERVVVRVDTLKQTSVSVEKVKTTKRTIPALIFLLIAGGLGFLVWKVWRSS